jgi:hypothetical protein
MGLAFIVGPNIWRLPVAEANTPSETRVKLALDTLLVPQWGAGAKVAAGLLMVLCAIVVEGWTTATFVLIPVVLLVALAVLAFSLAVARFGITRPDLDVVSLVIRRPGHLDRELKPISLGAMFIQLIAEIGVFPLVKLTHPSILYRPELVPSPSLTAIVAVVTATLSGLALLLWKGRFAIHAPSAQQAELEEALSG